MHNILKRFDDLPPMQRSKLLWQGGVTTMLLSMLFPLSGFLGYMGNVVFGAGVIMVGVSQVLHKDADDGYAWAIVASGIINIISPVFFDFVLPNHENWKIMTSQFAGFLFIGAVVMNIVQMEKKRNNGPRNSGMFR